MRKIIVIIALSCIAPIVNTEPLTTIGWVEVVRIQPEGLKLQAKIDTGADNSSLDVTSWEAYTHNGTAWIRFKVSDNSGNSRTFERPLEKHALIKRKRSDPVRRPVVKIWLCIGDAKYLAPVNLAKRENFKYRMLIGRSFLKDRFLVDSAKRQTLSPSCGP